MMAEGSSEEEEEGGIQVVSRSRRLAALAEQVSPRVQRSVRGFRGQASSPEGRPRVQRSVLEFRGRSEGFRGRAWCPEGHHYLAVAREEEEEEEEEALSWVVPEFAGRLEASVAAAGTGALVQQRIQLPVPQNVLGVDHDHLPVPRPDGKVVKADVQQVEGEVKVVVGQLLCDVHQLAGQVHPLLPGGVVEAPELLPHVVDCYHAAAGAQVLSERPALVRREALQTETHDGDMRMTTVPQQEASRVLGLCVAADDAVQQPLGGAVHKVRPALHHLGGQQTHLPVEPGELRLVDGLDEVAARTAGGPLADLLVDVGQLLVGAQPLEHHAAGALAGLPRAKNTFFTLKTSRKRSRPHVSKDTWPFMNLRHQLVPKQAGHLLRLRKRRSVSSFLWNEASRLWVLTSSTSSRARAASSFRHRNTRPSLRGSKRSMVPAPTMLRLLPLKLGRVLRCLKLLAALALLL
ncbi:LOW QUALITY PROTEIN: hypothetical protein CRUP_027737, partial [Coryphaenoides rupestris]